jgi:SAM-dependent methyltransferase
MRWYLAGVMADNATAHAATDYEREVTNTIPFHALILEQAVDVALAVVPVPRRWLDTGCGPGRLAGIAVQRAPETSFFLADPSEAMLALARGNNPELPADRARVRASSPSGRASISHCSLAPASRPSRWCGARTGRRAS